MNASPMDVSLNASPMDVSLNASPMDVSLSAFADGAGEDDADEVKRLARESLGIGADEAH